MKIRPRAPAKHNGYGGVTMALAVINDDDKDNEKLVFEEVVQLSKSRPREKFIQEVARRAKVSEERAREKVLEVLAEQQELPLDIPKDKPSAAGSSKAETLAVAYLDQEGRVKVFLDPLGVPHVAIWEEEDRRYVHRLLGTTFRRILMHFAYSVLGWTPSSEILKNAIDLLAAITRNKNRRIELHVRTAWLEESFHYDLGNGRAVRVTGQGYDVVTAPILFRHFPHQEEQVEPTSGGDLRDVLSFLNIADEKMQLLYIVDLVAGLIPGISRPISVFHGAHGSAKSTALKLKRKLMDPALPEIQSPPKDVADFARWGAHNMCLYLDNISSLPDWLSDAFARYCTGDGFSKRTLFTDDDDFILIPWGVGGIAGINLVVTAADLLDRSLVYKLERITGDRNITDGELWERFEKLRPSLLGAMFDALAGAIKLHPTIQRPDQLPRLADYAFWGCAVAQALGYPADEYWDALELNRKHQTEEALDASPVAQAVLEFMTDRTSWEGTATELLQELNTVAERLRIDVRAKAWPKDYRWVTRRINLVVPNLADQGIVFIVLDPDGKSRSLTLTRSGNDVSDVEDVNDVATDRDRDNNNTPAEGDDVADDVSSYAPMSDNKTNDINNRSRPKEEDFPF